MGGEVVIQVQYGTSNSKIGGGVQIWTLPMSWIERGVEAMNDDEASCMDCLFGKKYGGGCYVRKGFSNKGLMSKVRSLHRAYVDGRVNVLPIGELAANEARHCKGKFVRFGAYGEPVLLGEENVRTIIGKAWSFAGYTHQWHRDEYQWASKYFMASVETEAMMLKAHGKQWRTFRVRKKGEAVGREVSCPASKEGGRKVTCDVCGLCRGNRIGAKSVVIVKH